MGLKSRLNQCLYKDRDKNNKSQKLRIKTLARPMKFTLKQYPCPKFCYFGRNFPKLPQFTTFSMSPEILSIIFFVLPTFDFFRLTFLTSCRLINTLVNIQSPAVIRKLFVLLFFTMLSTQITSISQKLIKFSRNKNLCVKRRRM